MTILVYVLALIVVGIIVFHIVCKQCEYCDEYVSVFDFDHGYYTAYGDDYCLTSHYHKSCKQKYHDEHDPGYKQREVQGTRELFKDESDFLVKVDDVW